MVEAHGQVEKGRVRTGGCQKEKRIAPQQQRAHYHGTIKHSQPTARLTDRQNSHEPAHGERKAANLKNNANDVCVVLERAAHLQQNRHMSGRGACTVIAQRGSSTDYLTDSLHTEKRLWARVGHGQEGKRRRSSRGIAS